MTVLALAAVIIAPGVFSGSAEALPVQRTCKITTYYKQAEMTDVVGVRSTCSSPRSSGRTSRYFETETLQVESQPVGGSGSGPGSLPCEFLASGCSNLPTLRH
jgi:hypothetical protein